MAKDPVRVLVTRAAGQIGYALVPMIARGIMLGPDQPVILHMLDIAPAAEALYGVKMELVDAAFPLLKGIVATTDAVEACTGVNVAVMVGGFLMKEEMDSKDVISKNASICKSQALALEQHAAPNCKVLVVANPTNTNAVILKELAPSIPERNVTCLTRLDHNRALGQISEKLNVQVSDVKNVIIWGNHSLTQYPDVTHATVGDKPVPELIKDDEWLKSRFISTVQQHGAAIIKDAEISSALSVASSACDHIRDWVCGTPEGTWVSMGVYSDGSYNVPTGLIYSFPVTCCNGEWSVVQGMEFQGASGTPRPKFSLEDYLQLEKLDVISASVLRKIIMMHGFRGTNISKNDLITAVRSIDLMDAHNSTLQSDVSSLALIGSKEVITDLSSLQWEQEPVVSVETFNCVTGCSQVVDKASVKFAATGKRSAEPYEHQVQSHESNTIDGGCTSLDRLRRKVNELNNLPRYI